jgi:hypothetical protein
MGYSLYEANPRTIISSQTITVNDDRSEFAAVDTIHTIVSMIDSENAHPSDSKRGMGTSAKGYPPSIAGQWSI